MGWMLLGSPPSLAIVLPPREAVRLHQLPQTSDPTPPVTRVEPGTPGCVTAMDKDAKGGEAFRASEPGRVQDPVKSGGNWLLGSRGECHVEELKAEHAG